MDNLGSGLDKVGRRLDAWKGKAAMSQCRTVAECASLPVSQWDDAALASSSVWGTIRRNEAFLLRLAFAILSQLTFGHYYLRPGATPVIIDTELRNRLCRLRTRKKESNLYS